MRAPGFASPKGWQVSVARLLFGCDWLFGLLATVVVAGLLVLLSCSSSVLLVLTITGLTNAEYLISSVALSIDEYYSGVGESPGVWSGRWADGLGLSGVVEAGQLRALIDGHHPTSGEDLLVGLRPRRVRAFDLTFSAPKSVSLLWALGSEPVAGVVAAAHREAVVAAIGFLEDRAAVARVQVGRGASPGGHRGSCGGRVRTSHVEGG